MLFFSCAGGHERLPLGFLPSAIRNRLLRRALSFEPQAVVANGDHVYWDLLAPTRWPDARCLAGRRADCRTIRPLGARLRPHQRDGAEARRGTRRSCRCTARTSARRRCSSCRTITTTSTTTRRRTRSSRFRRHRSCCSSRARHSGSTTRSSCPMPAGRAASPGRRPAIGHRRCPRASARSDTDAGRNHSLRRAPNGDAGRAERGVRRSKSSDGCAARAASTDVTHLVHVPVESARLERRQMGRVVSRRARARTKV